MSGVQPYVPGQTGTLSDVIERDPELNPPPTPAGPDGFAAPPSWSQLFTAARPEALRSTPLYDDVKIGQGYAPIVDALGLPASENPGYFGDLDAAGQARFGFAGSPSRLATTARQGVQVPFGAQYLADRSLQESLVLSQIKARRLVTKNFLPGVPDDAEGLHQYFEAQQAAKRAAGAAVLARGSTFGRTTASIAAGGLESALHDPITLPSLVIGGGTASSFALAAGRDALINGVLAAAEQPIVAHNMAENNEHLTVGDVASSVASSAVFGAAVGGTVHLATHLPPALFHIMPEAVQTRWAARMKVGPGKDAPLLKDVLADMDNRELATFSRSAIGPDRMTPDENAAATVIERNQEIGEASPFEPGPVGDAAHNANLADALQGVIDGAPSSGAPILANRGALLSSTSAAALRPPAPIAAHGADFEAQWSAIKGNEHGIGSHGEFLTSKAGAIGPGQVMPGTAPHAAQLAGVPFDDHLYRTDAAYNEKLGRAYYAEQLRSFGDPEMAAAAYNAGPGSAARGTGLRGALRKAAEHGEPGNWRAWLPRETQKYVEDFRARSGGSPEAYQVGDAASDDEALAALQRSADQAEAEGLALSQEREVDVADLGRDRADVADVPVLKRELFPSENDWADAQAGFHRSLNAPEEAAGAPLSGETQPRGQTQPHSAEPPVGDLWRLSQEELQALADRKRMSDREQLVEAFGSVERAKRFEALDRTSNSMDLARADEASRLLEQEFGDLTPEQERLVYGIGETDAQVDDLKEMIKAHSDVVAGDDASWSAYMAAHAARKISAADFAAVPEGRGTVAAQAEYVRMANAYRNLAAAGIATDEIPRRMAAALVERGGWTPAQASEVISSFVDGMKGLRERAPITPGLQLTDARVDEPALKAFDDGGSGRVDQADSLEHDLRMAAAEPATAKKTYSPFGDDRQLTLTELFEELDRERVGVAALRACAGGGA